MKNEGAWRSTIPNVLTMSRILLTFIIMFLIFTEDSLIFPVIIFVIAAFTDFLDGQLARKFGWTSEFGRKADMVADRFLWAGTAIAFVIAYGLRGELGIGEGIQLALMMSREIISAPFAFIALIAGKPIPHARFIAKATTLMQGFALPAIILSLRYSSFIYLSLPLSIIIGATGTISAVYYIYDLQKVKSK